MSFLCRCIQVAIQKSPYVCGGCDMGVGEQGSLRMKIFIVSF